MARQQTINKPAVIIVMGVSGAGKTTVGKLIAAELGWQFRDADDFHNSANKAKMHAGTPLTDEDRLPWLESMADNIEAWLATGEKTVLACSALKESYRAILSGHKKEVAIVYLRADYEAIAGRLAARTDHFMNKDLLQSQFATLEEPGKKSTNRPDDLDGSGDETVEAMIVDATEPPETIVAKVRRALQLS